MCYFWIILGILSRCVATQAAGMKWQPNLVAITVAQNTRDNPKTTGPLL